MVSVTVLFLLAGCVAAQAGGPGLAIAPYVNLSYEGGGYKLETADGRTTELSDFNGVGLSGGARGSFRLGDFTSSLQLDLANLDQIADDTSLIAAGGMLTAGWQLGPVGVEIGGHYLHTLARIPEFPSGYSLCGAVLRAEAELGDASGGIIIEPRRRLADLAENELFAGLHLAYRHKFLEPYVGLGVVLRRQYTDAGTGATNRLEAPFFFSLGLGYAPLGPVSDFPMRAALPKALVLNPTD